MFQSSKSQIVRERTFYRYETIVNAEEEEERSKNAEKGCAYKEEKEQQSRIEAKTDCVPSKNGLKKLNEYQEESIYFTIQKS